MTPDAAWPDRLAAVVAGEIRRYRKMRGLTAQGLADRCAGLGLEVPRSVLANLESGRRTTVTVAELLVLSIALGVAPVLLVFPVGHELESEVRPGADASTWAAAEWFGGRGDFPAPPSGSLGETGHLGYRVPIQLFLRHQELVGYWYQSSDQVREYERRSLTENGGVRGLLDSARSTVAGIEGTLQRLREQIEAAGLTPPHVHPELAYRLQDGEVPR